MTLGLGIQCHEDCGAAESVRRTLEIIPTEGKPHSSV
jgi:hypothetical protein